MNNKLLKKHYNGHGLYRVIPDPYILTLQTDGHGTLTADKITGYAGDTVTLTPTNNTYYRFNNYQCTGGSIVGNTFTFSAQNATAKANFKTNDFTAKGNWLLPNDIPDYHTANGYETVFFAFANVTATNNNTIFVKDKSYIQWSRNAATRIQYIDVSALKIPEIYSGIKFQTEPGVMIVSGIGGGGQLEVNFMNSGSESKAIQKYAHAEVSTHGQSAKINLTATTSNYWGYYTLNGYGSSWRVGIVNPNATWSASGYAP